MHAAIILFIVAVVSLLKICFALSGVPHRSCCAIGMETMWVGNGCVFFSLLCFLFFRCGGGGGIVDCFNVYSSISTTIIFFVGCLNTMSFCDRME